MPIYEFFCPDNHRIYSFFARSLAYAGRSPRCPDNPKFRMERMISSFSFTGRAREEQPAGSLHEEDNPRFQASISEMEKEFSTMSDENPDPRQVARMMRKMAVMTGEKMPEQMQEMIKRMEEGENLEKLDEEFGQMTDDYGAHPNDTGGPEEQSNLQKLKARLQATQKRPQRDPVLYEMSDFVDPMNAKPKKTKRRGARAGEK
jgi:hypothetical protein